MMAPPIDSAHRRDPAISRAPKAQRARKRSGKRTVCADWLWRVVSTAGPPKGIAGRAPSNLSGHRTEGRVDLA